MTCALYKPELSAEQGAMFGYLDSDYGGLKLRPWFDLHHKRFLLPIEEITASRVPVEWHIPDLYEGVYFLFTDDALQYVGKSVRITPRLHKHAFPHWNRKQVPWITHYAALWVPCDLLDAVEGYYIHKLRPARNEQYRALHEWALPYIGMPNA